MNDIPGMWRMVAYPSGTVTVSDGRRRKTAFGEVSVGPHIYIGYRSEPGATPDHDRYELAHLISKLLNRETTHASGLRRVGEYDAISASGIRFHVTGPCVDLDPPSCNWKEDDRDEAKLARARLMDRVFGIGVKPQEDEDDIE